jgi:hypothetical protein
MIDHLNGMGEFEEGETPTPFHETDTVRQFYECARNGWDYDTCDQGRFLEKWADPACSGRAPRGLRPL